jgi:hypothetical protein
MKYIVYKKQDNKVLHILDKEPIAISDNLGLARCEAIPQGDKFSIANLQEKTEKYTDLEAKEVVKKDEQGNEYIETEYVEVEKEREYQVCELLASVDEKKPIRNQIAKLKNWFNNEYRYYNEKLTRFEALNIAEVVVDKVFNITYLSLNDLYVQAEKVRTEIKELEVSII